MKHSDALRQQLSVQRNVLKGQLLDRLRPILVQTSQTRVLVPRSIATIYSSNQLMGAECCYCWQWDNPESVRMDVHEIVFSRGSVQGAGDKAMLAIMDRRNCGFVHQKECHKMAEGGGGRLKATVGRLSRMGGEVLPYEIFTSKLGVGDVIIERLPNSLKIQINWNDSEAEPVGLYIVDIPEVARG